MPVVFEERRSSGPYAALKPGLAMQEEYEASGAGRYSTRTTPSQTEITVTVPGEMVADWDKATRLYGFDSRSALIRNDCTHYIRRLAKRAERMPSAEDIDTAA